MSTSVLTNGLKNFMPNESLQENERWRGHLKRAKGMTADKKNNGKETTEQHW